MAEYMMLICIAQVNGTWPMWGGEPTHQSVQLMKGAMNTAPAIRWGFATGIGFEYQFSAIADVDGDGRMEVVVGSMDSTVYCLSGANGSPEWAFTTGGEVLSSPAVADVNGDGSLEVVIGSDDHTVYCLDGATGNQEWAFTTGDWVWSSPAVADVNGDGGMEVVVGSMDSTVYCLDGATGNQEWAFATGYDVESSPAVADVDGDGGMEVVIGSDASTVHCLDGATGNQEWSYNTGSYVHTPGSIVDIDGDGLFEFLVPSYNDDTLRCLNAEDGSLCWQITLATDVHSPFVGDIDGDSCAEIIVGTRDPNANGYRVFVLDDVGDASDCGTMGDEEGEGGTYGKLDFRPMGQGLYLFVPHQIQISLSLYDASGRLVQNLYNGLLRPGAHTFIPKVKAKGVYLAVLRYPGGTKTLKMVR